MWEDGWTGKCSRSPSHSHYTRISPKQTQKRPQDQTATFLFESTSFFTENCARFVKGLALRNLVDKRAGY